MFFFLAFLWPLKAVLSIKHSLAVRIPAKMKESTILDRRRISPWKLFLAQTKVYPRAVFKPLWVSITALAFLEAARPTLRGLKTALGNTFQALLFQWSKVTDD